MGSATRDPLEWDQTDSTLYANHPQPDIQSPSPLALLADHDLMSIRLNDCPLGSSLCHPVPDVVSARVRSRTLERRPEVCAERGARWRADLRGPPRVDLRPA
eukprot:gene14623-biopygen7028